MKGRVLQIGLVALVVGCMLFLSLIPLERQAQAQGGSTLYVAPTGDCGGMLLCYDHPQDAVDAASEGDTIKVAGGTYASVSARPAPPGYPYPPASGLVTQTLYISRTLVLLGGYSTTNWAEPDPVHNPTTLDAQEEGRALLITGAISPTIVGLRITGGDATNLGGDLDYADDAGGGMYIITATATISDNQMFGNTAERGGGLYLFYGHATVSNNQVLSNTARWGGGMSLWDSGATLTGNTISYNSATYGGGVCLFYSHDTLSDNTISNNVANGHGGGLRVWSGTPTLSGNTISHNSATDRGGGLWLAYSDATVDRNTISHNASDEGDGGGLGLSYSNATLGGNTIISNIAGEQGGGLDLSDSAAMLVGNTISHNSAGYDGGGLCLHRSDATLINNLVAGNQATSLGSGLYIGGSSPSLLHTTLAHNTGGDGSGVYATDYYWNSCYATLTNTILVSHTVGITVTAGNTVTLESTLWYANGWDTGGRGDILTGTINVHDDPLFVDPGAEDYHLGFGSPAIDAGVDAGVTIDIDGDPRPMGGGFDIGADERSPTTVYLPVTLRDHSR